MPEDLPQLRDALSSRYRLGRELGRGGMAVVYLAEDVRHHRSVALKVLHPELAAAIGVERFVREIEIAAGLNHPHILPVYDSGEAAGRLYLVMPHVEGESLRERLAREGRLPVPTALRIAAEVADALDYAHRHGIVHRDIKPGNILLGGHHAWVSDFGVARALEIVNPDLTSGGVLLGTPVYMSPEQSSGDGEVDGRSDIYSLGCVLYEMLAGTPPFSGATVQAVLAKHMTETAPSLRRLRADVPVAVDLAVARALALRREDRFSTAGELWDVLAAATPASGASGAAIEAAPSGRPAGPGFRGVLSAGRALARRRPLASAVLALAALVAVVGLFATARGWMSGRSGESQAAGGRLLAPSGGRGSSLAVIPFDDYSPAQDHGYIAAGFTNELIQRLGRVEGLSVRSHQSVKPFAGGAVSVDSMQKALGVDYLVEGTVMPIGGSLRVTVSLVDARTGTTLGNEMERAPLDSVTVLLDEVSLDVSRFLRTRLGSAIRVRDLRARTRSDTAWLLVQRAEERRDAWRPLLEAGDTAEAAIVLRQADSLLAAAERIDPGWTDPVVLRGWVARELGLLATPTPGVAETGPARAALELADRALERAPNSPDALELRGTVRYDLFQQAADTTRLSELLEGARSDLEAAVSADPARPSAWLKLSELRYRQGDFDGAYRAAVTAQQEDRFLREDDQVIARLAQYALDLQRFDEALAWAREGRQRWPDDVGFPATELTILATSAELADPAWAWALADTILAAAAPHRRGLFRPIFLAQVAATLALAGRRDSALAVLGRAVVAADGDSVARAYAAYDFAHTWLVLGNRDESVRWLAIDVENRPYVRPQHARDQWFAPLRDDPRFRELVGTGD